jgi:pimeloyl-ACP methyl ester carboxylesterase
LKRWQKRLLLAVLLLPLLLLFVVFPVGASFLITNARFRFPERGPQSPQDIGLRVDPVQFTAADGIVLEGWWSAGLPDSPVIIFIHGLNRSRRELLERGREADKQGYGVLLFDLRNHGESGRAYTTLGIREAQDVCAAGSKVRKLAPERKQVLWGVSLGAATALLAVRDCGGFDAVIADSAFLSFRETIAHHLGLYFRLPAFPIANMIVGITALRMGFDPGQGDVEAAVKGFGDVPVLFIAGERDRRMPPEVARRLFDAATSSSKEFLLVPGAPHGEAFRTDRELYTKAVFDFISRTSGKARSSP